MWRLTYLRLSLLQQELALQHAEVPLHLAELHLPVLYLHQVHSCFCMHGHVQHVLVAHLQPERTCCLAVVFHHSATIHSCLRLLLGTEAPITTPNVIDFSFSSLFLSLDSLAKHLLRLVQC